MRVSLEDMNILGHSSLLPVTYLLLTTRFLTVWSLEHSKKVENRDISQMGGPDPILIQATCCVGGKSPNPQDHLYP